MGRASPIYKRVCKKIVEYFKNKGMGSLHVLEGTLNAERYIKSLEQHMLPSI